MFLSSSRVGFMVAQDNPFIGYNAVHGNNFHPYAFLPS